VLEANELREYLKTKPQPSQAELARKVLREIEERQPEEEIRPLTAKLRQIES
jgi:hypothetical protein